MRKYMGLLVTAVLVLTAACSSLPAGKQDAAVICRLASRETGTVRTITVLTEDALDTRSSDAAERTVEAVIHDGRRLSATVRHVDIRMPRERFNISLLLNDSPHLRINHMDLDIYLETAIDGHIYLLHCMRDFESLFSSGN